VSVVDEHVGDGDEHGHANRPEQAAINGHPDESGQEGHGVGRSVEPESATPLCVTQAADLGHGLPLGLEEKVAGQMGDQQGAQQRRPGHTPRLTPPPQALGHEPAPATARRPSR
jgi:hypothetical protein